ESWHVNKGALKIPGTEVHFQAGHCTGSEISDILAPKPDTTGRYCSNDRTEGGYDKDHTNAANSAGAARNAAARFARVRAKPDLEYPFHRCRGGRINPDCDARGGIDFGGRGLGGKRQPGCEPNPSSHGRSRGDADRLYDCDPLSRRPLRRHTAVGRGRSYQTLLRSRQDDFAAR